jgi:hypothetical protein
VLSAVAQDALAREHALAEPRADREVVLAAVAQDGCALRYASEELRADRELVMTAVAQDGRALEHASAGLRADREVVQAAVAQDPRALTHASTGVRRLVWRLRRFRPFQRLLLATVESRGCDSQTTSPWTLGAHLPLSHDIRQMVQGHLAASATVPGGSLGVAFAWHVAQAPLADERAFRFQLIVDLMGKTRKPS